MSDILFWQTILSEMVSNGEMTEAESEEIFKQLTKEEK